MTSLQLTSKQVDTVMELLSDVLCEGIDAPLVGDQDKSNDLISLWDQVCLLLNGAEDENSTSKTAVI